LLLIGRGNLIHSTSLSKEIKSSVDLEKALNKAAKEKNTRESRGGGVHCYNNLFKVVKLGNSSKTSRIERERPVKDTPIPFP